MNIEIKFEALPWWKGLQNNPGVRGVNSFGLGWDGGGFIKQTTVEQMKKKVVDLYLAEEYAFITSPPGSSDWSNHLAGQDIGFLTKHYGEELAGKSVLEIGAGSLFIAEKLTTEYGLKAYTVVDPAVSQTPSDERILVLRGYFDRETCSGAQYDIIMAFHCLEHVADPVQFLRDIRAVLAPGGKAVLAFPDIQKQFVIGDYNAILHEHMSYFTPDSACRLMTNCGFKIIEVALSHDCIRLLAEAAQQDNINLPLVTVPMDPLLSMAAASFQQNLQVIDQLLGKALESGKKVAFHGATNGLNNILYLTGLTDEKRFWVFDGDGNKRGKFVPACPSPVRHSEDPLYRKMELVLVSAVTFFDEIKEFLINRHGLRPEQIQPLFQARSPLADMG